MEEPKHIQEGRKVAASLKEDDVKAKLLKRLHPYIARNVSIERFMRDIADMGGTFGEWYGYYETGPRSRNSVEVELRDGRKFRFSKAEIYENQAVQGVLL